MNGNSATLQSRRRAGLRYTILLFSVLALIAGWTAFWKFAAGKAEVAIDGWREREAKAGRIYSCGSESVAGYPFRIEVNCDRPSALFHSSQPPIEVKTDGLMVAAQVYQPGLLISEFHGPLTAGEPGKPPDIAADWKLAQSSVRGTQQLRNVCRSLLINRRSNAQKVRRGKACCVPSASKFTGG